MSFFHTPHSLPRVGRTIFPAYMGAAVAATVVITAWIATLQGGPALEAQHVETNSEGAWFKVVDVHGEGARPLAWSDLETSVRIQPILDRDGLIQAEEPFFVPTTRPGMTHLVTIGYQGHVLWSGAFQAAEDDPLRLSVLDDIAPPPGASEPWSRPPWPAPPLATP